MYCQKIGIQLHEETNLNFSFQTHEITAVMIVTTETGREIGGERRTDTEIGIETETESQR